MYIRLKSPSSITAQINAFQVAHGKSYPSATIPQNLISMVCHRGWKQKKGSLNIAGNYVFDKSVIEFEEDELLELMDSYNIDLQYIDCGILSKQENGNYALHWTCYSSENDSGPRQYRCGEGPTTHTINALHDNRMPDGCQIPRPKTVTNMESTMGKKSRRAKKQRAARLFGPQGPRKIQVSYAKPEPEEHTEEPVSYVKTEPEEHGNGLSEKLRPLIEQAKMDYADLEERLRKKGEFLEQLEDTITNIGLNKMGLL